MRATMGPKSNQLTALGRKMDSSIEIHSQGVEAAQRPQLTPVPTFQEYPDWSGHSRPLSLFVTYRKNTSPFSSARLLTPIEPFCRESCEELRKSASRNGQSKFKSVRTKSLINSFTNRLGPVYHLRIINMGWCN